MSWSVIKKEGSVYEPSYLFQPFTEEEWQAYPFAGEEKLKWFRDAKLGLFFHVGISAVGKVDIGWSRQTHKLPDPNEGAIPDEIYDGWAKELKMEEFDAREWINLAVEGGFKYVVIITKHHDGFHMWDTSYSDYKITNAPMGRDYLKEIVDACHERNLKVGLYYSERDWHHPDYEPIDTRTAKAIDKIPFYEVNQGETLRSGSRHSMYIKYMHNTVLELMEKYGTIDILWWDASWYNGMFLEEMWDSLKLEKEVRERQPNIIINNRASVPGDFDTPECRVGFVQRQRAWETCMPMGEEWAWTGRGLKSWKEIMHQFLYSVCGDGNYLLSIGAMANGKIASEETGCIKQIGEWLGKYGESVYGTRSGPWNPGNYGGSVYCEDKIYLHILNKPQSNILTLPMTKGKVKEIVCLTGELPQIIKKDKSIIISNFDNMDESVDMILKITMDELVQISEEGEKVPEQNIRFDREPSIFGTVLDERVEGSVNFYVDLGKVHKVTALSACISKGNIQIETSLDNEYWESFHHCLTEDGEIEMEFSSYVAGAPVCGKNIRYIRIKEKEEIELGNIRIYGF